MGIFSGVDKDLELDMDKTPKEVKNFEELDIDLKNSETSMNEETQKEKEILDRISEGLGVPYSSEQRDIIRHRGSPLNVVSCAGSGKTAVLIAKMLFRYLHDGVEPYNMLTITFNTKASREIQTRYNEGLRQLGLSGKPEFKTFHALFLLMLRSIPKYRNVDVLASSAKFNFTLYKLIKKTSDDTDKSEVLTQMMNQRSYMLNLGTSTDGIENIEKVKDLPFDLENYKTVVTKYNDLKNNTGEIDFDDMIVLLHKEIFVHKNTDLITNFRTVFKDIYVDEYQDISNIQIEILDELIEDKNRLVAIGDDDQSIYSFRGSDPSFIRDFLIRYDNADRLFLSTNYRCKNRILDPVIPSIETNKIRVDKKINAFNEGGDIQSFPFPTYREICQKIRQDTEMFNIPDYANSAILVRTNNQRMILTDMLAEQGVQVNIGRIEYSLRNNKAYRTALGIVKAIKDESNISFGNYMRPLLPHLRKSVFDSYKKNVRTSWYQDLVIENRYHIPEATKDLIEKIRNQTSMSNILSNLWLTVKSYYADLESKGFGNVKKVAEVYQYLFQIGQQIPFHKFLELEKAKEGFIRMYHESPLAIEIHTMHTVKGLEFDNVYMVGLNNDIIPDENYLGGLDDKIAKIQKQLATGIPSKHKELESEILQLQERKEQYIEEERRLFYVAWTRAKERLHIQYNPDAKSMFLNEVDFSTIEVYSNKE